MKIQWLKNKIKDPMIKKKTSRQEHTRDSFYTLSVSLKRSQQNNSNHTLKNYQPLM